MLQCLLRYNHMYKYISQSPSKKKNYNVFFRKYFFKSLVMYLNVLYANLNLNGDKNYFYFIQFISSIFNTKHHGFYFNKYMITL